jgi:hypothetical protein
MVEESEPQPVTRVHFAQTILDWIRKHASDGAAALAVTILLGFGASNLWFIIDRQTILTHNALLVKSLELKEKTIQDLKIGYEATIGGREATISALREQIQGLKEKLQDSDSKRKEQISEFENFKRTIVRQRVIQR